MYCSLDRRSFGVPKPNCTVSLPSRTSTSDPLRACVIFWSSRDRQVSRIFLIPTAYPKNANILILRRVSTGLLIMLRAQPLRCPTIEFNCSSHTFTFSNHSSVYIGLKRSPTVPKMQPAHGRFHHFGRMHLAHNLSIFCTGTDGPMSHIQALQEHSCRIKHATALYLTSQNSTPGFLLSARTYAGVLQLRLPLHPSGPGSGTLVKAHAAHLHLPMQRWWVLDGNSTRLSVAPPVDRRTRRCHRVLCAAPCLAPITFRHQTQSHVRVVLENISWLETCTSYSFAASVCHPASWSGRLLDKCREPHTNCGTSDA